MAKVTLFFVENEEETTTGIDVDMDFIPRVGESVQGFFASGRNGNWVVKNVNYQLYEDDNKLEAHYSVSLRRWEYPNDEMLETFKKSESGEDVDATENFDDLRKKLDIAFKIDGALNEVAEDQFLDLRFRINNLEEVKSKVDNLENMPLSQSYTYRISLYKKIGALPYLNEKILEVFSSFLDTADNLIFEKIMENEDSYKQILMFRGQKIKETTLKNKIREFNATKKLLDKKNLIKKIHSIKNSITYELNHLMEYYRISK